MTGLEQTLRFCMRPFVYVYAFWLREVEKKKQELTNETRYLQARKAANISQFTYVHYLRDGTCFEFRMPYDQGDWKNKPYCKDLV